MKNIHLIETDKPSRLHITGSLNLYPNGVSRKPQGLCKNQHIYITSDEKIKEGDWCLHLGKSFTDNILSDKITLVKISERYLSMNSYFWKQGDKNSQFSYSENKLRKIILTTDQDLINDDIQAIDDEFLEWFVENPNCEEIYIEKFHGIKTSIAEISAVSGNDDYNWKGTRDLKDYKIIIPQEEPKQETLEEAAERYIAEDNYNRYYNDFIEGAKWQQEKNNTSKVTRFEVIQHSHPYNGRAYTNYNAKDVEIQFQDDGKTLKIFLK